MKKLLSNQVLMKIIIGALVVGGVAILAEIWFQPFNETFLFKLLATCGVVIVLAGILKAVVADMDEDKKDLG